MLPTSTTRCQPDYFSASCRGLCIRFRRYPLSAWELRNGPKAREAQAPIDVRVRALIVEIQRAEPGIVRIAAVAAAIREPLSISTHIPLGEVIRGKPLSDRHFHFCGGWWIVLDPLHPPVQHAANLPRHLGQLTVVL